jgi:hypothetical protein
MSLLAQQKEVLEMGRSKDLWKRRMETFDRKDKLDNANHGVATEGH